MRKTLAILVSSTALTAAIGVIAWSAMGSAGGADTHPITADFGDGQQALPLILVSGDDDDDDDEDRRRFRHSRDDGDDDNDGDDDDDEDDDDDDLRGGRNPAPAGTVAPPANGLFGNGMPPQVQVN